MARPLRIEFPGAFYHITSRGNARAPIFLGDTDREEWLQIVGQVSERFHWRVYAYCQMGNHFHLLVQTSKPNLSRCMRHLNGVYTHRCNRCHGRGGHLLLAVAELLSEFSRTAPTAITPPSVDCSFG